MTRTELHKPALQKNWIDPSANKIVESLQTAGFQTYLVGGCVRDLLAGIHPKDFDIATSASPNEVKRKISGSYIIGKRFRLVLVKRGEKQFEVATFRRNISAEEQTQEDNPVVGDNYFGTCEEDAQRRDFTINALFYDPVKNDLIDYVNGMDDINSRTLRMIGPPEVRFREDPIRILRALRLSHKLNFSLEPELRAAMITTAPDLIRAVLPRRREEWLKILRLPQPTRAFAEMYDLGILASVFPSLHKLYENREKAEAFEEMLERIPKVGIEMAFPEELFSAFMYCFARAESPEHRNIVPNENLDRIMRDELGMFKVESSIFYKNMDLIGALGRRESYLRKGPRRQQNFVHNEGLLLSLRLARIDHFMSEVDLGFWLGEIERFKNAPPSRGPAMDETAQ